MTSKIAIAYEDVITEDSDLWADFMKYARLEGHQIYVIGEEPPYSLSEALDYNGLYQDLHFDRQISLYNYLITRGEDMTFNQIRRKWICRIPEVWAGSKARLCAEFKISLMFEDNYLFAHPFGFIPTRLEMFCNVSVREMVIETTRILKERNKWFDDYEGEFNVTQM